MQRGYSNLSYSLVARQIIRDSYEGFKNTIYSAFSTLRGKVITAFALLTIGGIANVSFGAIKNPFNPEEHIRAVAARLKSEQGRDILLNGFDMSRAAQFKKYRALTYKPEARPYERALQKKPIYVIFPRKGPSLKKVLYSADTGGVLEHKARVLEEEDFKEELRKALHRAGSAEVKKNGLGAIVDGVGVILKKADECPPLDYFIWEGDPEGVLGYIVLLPVNCGLDYLKTAGAIANIPGESMERAKIIKARKYQGRENPADKGPIEAACVLGEDTLRFGSQIVVVCAEGAVGTLEYILNNPLDTAAKTAFTWWLVNEIRDELRHDHKTKHAAVAEKKSDWPFPGWDDPANYRPGTAGMYGNPWKGWVIVWTYRS